MMRTLLSICFIICGFSTLAQVYVAPPEVGFMDLNSVSNDNLPPEYRLAVQKNIQSNIDFLAQKGVFAVNPNQRPLAAVKFAFPLRQAAGFSDPSFYGISNFVDLNPTGTKKDFNCGTRTYKGHKGTDFFTAPFWWEKMDENAVEVIAAADGIVVAKNGSSEDKNCVNCAEGAPASCYNWNAVYVQHADGTIAFYGHMKKNSLTTKVVGDAVTKGEFLGVVGSSGNSSGPHLHFELWKDETFAVLIDPWAGTCNTSSTESLWENQEPYYNHKILKIITSSTNIARWKQCYDDPLQPNNSKTTFRLGETVFITPFVRDNITGGPVYAMKLINPDGIIIYNWSLPSYTGFYSWLYYTYNFTSDVINKVGTWKFQLSYSNDFVEHKFSVEEVTPLNLLRFTGKKMNDLIQLKWDTEQEINFKHFDLEKSSDALNFSEIGRIASAQNGSGHQGSYVFNDRNPIVGVQYYRLKMVDKDGKLTYSEVITVDFGSLMPAKIYPNPAGQVVTIKNVSGFNKLVISNMNGQVVFKKDITGDEDQINISSLSPGIYVLKLTGSQKEQKLKLVKR